MTNNYTDKETIEGLLGWDITATSRPTLKSIGIMLNLADDKINGELRRPVNLSDPNHAFRPIATSLVMKMVNNMFTFAEPEDYAFIEMELTDADIRTIHLAYSNWALLSWKMGD